MTFLQRLLFLIFLLTTGTFAAAQQSSIDEDIIYGSDPLLYNGRFYTFFPPLNTGGNQFFIDSQFELGSITLRGVTYTNLMLNYDIYNQLLILKHKNLSGGTNLIIISDAWLEKFDFDGKKFEVISIQDTVKRIFQVMGSGPNLFMYFWKKGLILENYNGAKNHIFSDAKKEMNLFNGIRFMKFRNNKSFCLLFDPENRIAVKRYLHDHKINMKKTSDVTMTGLRHYCNTLKRK